MHAQGRQIDMVGNSLKFPRRRGAGKSGFGIYTTLGQCAICLHKAMKGTPLFARCHTDILQFAAVENQRWNLDIGIAGDILVMHAHLSIQTHGNVIDRLIVKQFSESERLGRQL